MLYITDDSKYRFKKDDLNKWNKLYKYDLAYSKLSSFEKLVSKTKKTLEDNILNINKLGVSISYGKDSMVCYDLINRMGIPFKLTHILRHELSTIEIKNKLLLNKNKNIEYIEFQRDRQYGNNDIYINIEKNNDKDFFKTVNEMNKIVDCYIFGIRISEHGNRQYRLKKYGIIHKNTNNKISCCPLAYWNINDIFAYHAKYELITHPYYAMLSGGFNRDRIRVDTLIDHRGLNSGRWLWTKIYYPEIYKEYTKIYNDLTMY